MPRETLTYNIFKTYSFVGNSEDPIIVIGNYELGCEEQIVIIEDAASWLSATPSSFVARLVPDGANHFVHVIRTGKNATQFAQALTVIQDTSHTQIFTKHRVVSSGARFFKTSVSDTESGTLDMYYNRDGSGLDEATAVATLFERPSSHSTKLYLSGSSHALRGRTGFIGQANYRPFDMNSFDMKDGHRSAQEALYGDKITPIWLVDTVTGLLYSPTQIENGEMPAGNQVGIVVQSLQQRHTFIARIEGRSQNLNLSMEWIQHLEGIPEHSKYGFLSKNSAQLKNYGSPLEIIQRMPTTMIFADYYM